MELHLALRNIIKTDGVDILYEPRLVNILCDFQAFDSIPASKYMLRAIIEDGYTKKLIQIGAWNLQAQSLSGQFSTITGFLPDITWIIFSSIAYGMGWISLLPPYAGPSSSRTSNKASNIVPSINPNSTNEDIVAYLNNVVERKPQLEQALGVDFTNISFDYKDWKDGEASYNCFVEINGTLNEPYLKIKVSIFGLSGAIIAHNYGGISQSDYKGYAVIKIGFSCIKYTADKIKRIVVYPE